MGKRNKFMEKRYRRCVDSRGGLSVRLLKTMGGPARNRVSAIYHQKKV